MKYIKDVDTTMNKFSLEEESFSAIFAKRQSEGRGRSKNRKWNTNSFNLLTSILIKNKDIKNEQILPLIVALSLIESIDILYNLKAQIKWPNDIILNSKKIAGFIIDSKKDLKIVGLGLNVYEKDFPSTYKIRASSLINEGAKLSIFKKKEIIKILKLFIQRLKINVKEDKEIIKKIREILFKSKDNIKFYPGSSEDFDKENIDAINAPGYDINNDGAILILGKAYYAGELFY